MSAISSVPNLLQLVFITVVDGEEREVNLGAPGIFKIPADTVHATITAHVSPGIGVVQIFDLDDAIWWQYAWSSESGDVLALRFADGSSEPSEDEMAFAKPFHDVVVGEDTDKSETVDYEALFKKLAPNLKETTPKQTTD